MRKSLCAAVAVLTFMFFALALASASITGSISGVVTDASGAVLPGASVIATDTLTGIKTSVKTDAKGFYSLPALPIGTYDLEISHAGFKTYRKTGMVIDANAAIRADAGLDVGAISEQVEVRMDSVHVETQSTQMGEVIESKSIEAVPLNGRSYIDLLALQPGVSPYNSGDTGTPGLGDAGNQSVNGQRETSNGFMVNGSNVEEGKNNGAAIIPNLDSIEEFRIITNNFDAEYGNYSGGQINVVTKSGTNNFHGSGFEFLRNTALDATQYFTDSVPVFRQNQFGSTFGGPIRKDKTFFFVDYQGTRQTQSSPATTTVPSAGNFTGDFSDSASSLTGSVGGPGFAAVLNQRMSLSPNTIFDTEPYYFDGCTSQSQCVFPNAFIPKQAWSPVAVSMLNLGLIPQPNVTNPTFNFSSSKYAQTLRDDKGGIRVDQNSLWNLIRLLFHRRLSSELPVPKWRSHRSGVYLRL